jgi:hypothetical protein
MASGRKMKTKNQEVEPKFIIKHGGLFFAQRGLTTSKIYARQFTKEEAETRKSDLADDKIFVEIIEVVEQ